MKKIKNLIILLCIALVSFMLLTGCEGFKLDLSKAKWPYSDKGEAEIKVNFEAVQKDNFKGVYFWDVTRVDASDKKVNYSLKYYADKTGAVQKEKFVYNDKDKNLAILILTDTAKTENATAVYYIDQKNNTFTTQSIPKYAVIQNAGEEVEKYGLINLIDSETKTANWTFVSKKDGISVKNYNGETESTVQYEYKGAGRDYNNADMYVNFRNVITPVIARIYYEIKNNGVIEDKITVYVPIQTDKVKDTDFTVPSTENGYASEDIPE